MATTISFLNNGDLLSRDLLLFVIMVINFIFFSLVKCLINKISDFFFMRLMCHNIVKIILDISTVFNNNHLQ